MFALLCNIDLHYGRTNFAINKNYVEFSFYACFYEIFLVDNPPWETELNGTELSDALGTLNILVNKELIIEKYSDRNNHDVEVFHSSEDEQVFAYFDLEKDSTDQNDMFFLGIRCKKTDEIVVHGKLLNIYRLLKTSSAFSFDIINHQLYEKVFRSYFYFYNDNYNQHKRQLNHHNL